MRLISSVLAVAAVVACSDSFKPSVDSLEGDYSLQTLTTTDSSGATTNWVAAGATFTISLAANGTTSGRLFIPGAGAGGGDFDEDMAGTWTLAGDVVTFDQTADTFVRDMPFIAGRDRLSGDHQFDVRVRIALTK